MCLTHKDALAKFRLLLTFFQCLGNLKWGFNPPGVTKVGDVERMQTKWDRDHDIKLKVRLETKQNLVRYRRSQVRIFSWHPPQGYSLLSYEDEDEP